MLLSPRSTRERSWLYARRFTSKHESDELQGQQVPLHHQGNGVQLDYLHTVTGTAALPRHTTATGTSGQPHGPTTSRCPLPCVTTPHSPLTPQMSCTAPEATSGAMVR